MSGLRWNDYYWLAWLGLLWLTFLPVELWVHFAKHDEWTLSDTVWTWTNQDLAHPWNIGHYTWPHWLLIGFMTWLWLHLCWGLIR